LKIRSKSRKIAEQHKKNKHFLQQALDGGIAFVLHLHCRICVALQKQKMASYSGAKVSIPHRTHHLRCPQNIIHEVDLSVMLLEVEKYAKKMIERNNLPLAKCQLEGLTSVAFHHHRTECFSSSAWKSKPWCFVFSWIWHQNLQEATK
jgi:hypothetical protein